MPQAQTLEKYQVIWENLGVEHSEMLSDEMDARELMETLILGGWECKLYKLQLQ